MRVREIGYQKLAATAAGVLIDAGKVPVVFSYLPDILAALWAVRFGFWMVGHHHVFLDNSTTAGDIFTAAPQPLQKDVPFTGLFVLQIGHLKKLVYNSSSPKKWAGVIKMGLSLISCLFWFP